MPNSDCIKSKRRGYIYGLTADGVTRYVGQSVMAKNVTLSRHRARARNGWELYVYNWMRHVGIDSVQIVILERASQDRLNARERHWIRQFDKLTNILPGGQRWGSKKCPPECECKKHHDSKVEAECLQCGKKFKYRDSSHNGIYCSWKCLLMARRRKPTKVCFLCKRVSDRPGKTPQGKTEFCSVRCWRSFLRSGDGGARRKILGTKCLRGCKCGRHQKRHMSRETIEKLAKAKTLPPIFRNCAWCCARFRIQRKHPRVMCCSRKCTLKLWHNQKGHKVHA